MVARRRTQRIARSLHGRWLRRGGSEPLHISDVSAHGMFLRDPPDLPIGVLQQIEVDLPSATVRLMVIPRHVSRAEWSRGIGLEIYATSSIDRELWFACFQSAERHLRKPIAVEPA